MPDTMQTGLRYIAMERSVAGRWGYVMNGQEYTYEQYLAMYREWRTANPGPAGWGRLVRRERKVWNDRFKAETPQRVWIPTSEDGHWSPWCGNGAVISLYDSPGKAKRRGSRILVVDLSILPQLEYANYEKEYEDMERLANIYMERAEEARRKMRAADNV